jgi:hypothetical protein
MWNHKRNSILITTCVLLFGCTSSDKKGTKKVSEDAVTPDISVVVKVNDEKNEEYSAALADFYKERKFKAVVGDSTAGTFVIGDLSEEDNKVKFILRVFKGNHEKPCGNYIYEAIVNGDVPEKIIEQGFKNLLNDMKAKPRTPVCP